MKKWIIAMMCLMLTATVLTACTDRNKPMETTRPTTAPATMPATVPATQPATAPSTMATTEATMPSETVDRGNGPIDPTNGADGTVGRDSTEATGGTSGAAGRGRGMPAANGSR